MLYYLTVTTFFTHELDAVKRREWRLIPGFSLLSDKAAGQIFIWLNLPVFALLLIGGNGDPPSAVRIGISAFAVVHVGLHWLYRHHPANECNNASSWTLIPGTGLLGAANLSWSLGMWETPRVKAAFDRDVKPCAAKSRARRLEAGRRRT